MNTIKRSALLNLLLGYTAEAWVRQARLCINSHDRGLICIGLAMLDKRLTVWDLTSVFASTHDMAVIEDMGEPQHSPLLTEDHLAVWCILYDCIDYSTLPDDFRVAGFSTADIENLLTYGRESAQHSLSQHLTSAQNVGESPQSAQEAISGTLTTAECLCLG